MARSSWAPWPKFPTASAMPKESSHSGLPATPGVAWLHSWLLDVSILDWSHTEYGRSRPRAQNRPWLHDCPPQDRCTDHRRNGPSPKESRRRTPDVDPKSSERNRCAPSWPNPVGDPYRTCRAPNVPSSVGCGPPPAARSANPSPLKSGSAVPANGPAATGAFGWANGSASAAWPVNPLDRTPRANKQHNSRLIASSETSATTAGRWSHQSTAQRTRCRLPDRTNSSIWTAGRSFSPPAATCSSPRTAFSMRLGHGAGPVATEPVFTSVAGTPADSYACRV